MNRTALDALTGAAAPDALGDATSPHSVEAAKPASTPRQMPVGRRWKPGESGNRKGTSRTEAELRRITRGEALAACPEAIRFLVETMHTAKRTKDRIDAAGMILDRGLGKPLQAVEVTGEDGAPLLDASAAIEAIRLEAARIRAARQRQAALIDTTATETTPALPPKGERP